MKWRLGLAVKGMNVPRDNEWTIVSRSRQIRQFSISHVGSLVKVVEYPHSGVVAGKVVITISNKIIKGKKGPHTR